MCESDELILSIIVVNCHDLILFDIERKLIILHRRHFLLLERFHDIGRNSDRKATKHRIVLVGYGASETGQLLLDVLHNFLRCIKPLFKHHNVLA